MPKFSFNTLPFGTTLARQIARQHLSILNNVFWVGERSQKLIGSSYKSLYLPKPAPGVHGCFEDEKTWKEGTEQFRVWRRQHTLISTASLLEVYIKSVSVAALWAMPELLDRSLTGIDSVQFIKFPDRAPPHFKKLVESSSKSVTEGLWTKRLTDIGCLFGKIPDEIVKLTDELQQMQTRRNKIAHSYGIDGELRKTPWEPMTSIEISLKYLEEKMKITSLVIKKFDEIVFGPLIGGYEIFHEFDVWSKKHKNIRSIRVMGNLHRSFGDHIGNAFGTTPGTAYLKSMIEHYEAIT